MSATSAQPVQINSRQLPTVDDVVKVFTRINLDCAKDGEDVIPLTDVDYYSSQISNIWDDLDETTCIKLAQAMALAA